VERPRGRNLAGEGHRRRRPPAGRPISTKGAAATTRCNDGDALPRSRPLSCPPLTLSEEESVFERQIDRVPHAPHGLPRLER